MSKKQKKVITEPEMFAMLQEFGQQQSVAIGGHIKVTITPHSTHFEPEPGWPGFKYEDSQYLCETIRGAQSFLWWLMRQNKTIV